MGVAIHRDRKVIIKRRYVVGGQTLITPERAPARTVAIKEDAREVILTRYGGDLEMVTFFQMLCVTVGGIHLMHCVTELEPLPPTREGRRGA